MSGDVRVRGEEGEKKAMGREVYVLMVGYPGEIRDPDGSDLVFPYIYGATLGVFHSMEELRTFFASIVSVASDFIRGIPLDLSAKKHGISEEAVKRVITISAFFRLADPSHGYSVLKYSDGEYSVIDGSELFGLISGLIDAPLLGSASA